MVATIENASDQQPHRTVITTDKIADLQQLLDMTVPNTGTHEMLNWFAGWRAKMLNTVPDLLALAERPASEEVEMRASSLEVYANDAFRRANAEGDAWLGGLALGLRDAAALLRRLAHPRQSELQPRVAEWMQACFGPEISNDRVERNHRFVEEALELAQALGCTKSEAHQLVDYVYGRPRGDADQEVGGVMVTLAALCLANGFDMHSAGETELARVWTKIDKIRAKQAAKPKHSPLPEHPRQSEGWQSISTAPKDGQIIWVWLYDTGARPVMWTVVDEDGAWVEAANGEEEWEPKWWLPYDAIPAPPESHP